MINTFDVLVVHAFVNIEKRKKLFFTVISPLITPRQGKTCTSLVICNPFSLTEDPSDLQIIVHVVTMVHVVELNRLKLIIQLWNYCLFVLV